MSTTLTNGLKLPDKGSVDWYADMQSNYTILDGAVGTIAEHTSQIAGKAPAVHTHTKSDITDFPAYGNTAGTICEGNDSRLSDARTPVAHTHTKSDVTDLFNSANTWTGNQTYTGMMILNSSSDVVEQFRQKLPKDVSTSSDALVRFNTLVDSAGHNVIVNSEGHWDTYVAKSIALKYKNDSTKQGSIEIRLRSDGSGVLYAQSPFECDLGNSSNQWNNLYAKNYYYNGTAWGLDKENAWSGNNRFVKNVGLYDISTYSDNTMAFTALRSVIFFNTTGSSNRQSYGTFLYAGYTAGSKPDNYGQLQLLRSTDKKGETNNGLIPDTSFTMWRVAPHYLLMDFMDAVRVTNDGTENSLKPITNNATDLGTSDNKWKTLNGINPGALSLPGNSSGINTDNWDKTGATVNSYTPAVDGWLVLRCKDVAGDYLFATWSGGAMRVCVTGQGLITLPTVGLCLYIPVKAGTTVDCVVKATDKFGAYIYPCLGNV